MTRPVAIFLIGISACGGDNLAPLPSEGTPAVWVEPSYHEFEGPGTVSITIGNDGTTSLKVDNLKYSRTSTELIADPTYGMQGALPWVIEPGDRREVQVAYNPALPGRAEATLSVYCNDPNTPVALAAQAGNPLEPEVVPFATGWYIFDDLIAYETTSSSAHLVDHHGDPDLYWYEPSGAHGLIDSADPAADFARMRQYILERTDGPVAVSGPLSFSTNSDLATFELATFTYIMSDFTLTAADDPAWYEISAGVVDDGIQVMVNGEILGRATLGNTGAWSLANSHQGLNTLIVILVDDSHDDRFVHDLAFLRNGVMVQ